VKPVVTWCLIAANLAVFFYEAGASQLALDRMIEKEQAAAESVRQPTYSSTFG